MHHTEHDTQASQHPTPGRWQAIATVASCAAAWLLIVIIEGCAP